MIWLALLIGAIILFIISFIALNNDWYGTGYLCFVIASIFIITSILTGISWGSCRLRYESSIVEYQQTRAVLINELRKYENMRENDVTGSTTYLELQKEIIDFNYNINMANNINNVWLDYALIDPAYREIEPIPISIG